MALVDALTGSATLELVSVDSAQVYRGLDVGSAKPDPEVLSRYPHHLIDICEPTERYNAGRFRRDALAICEDIRRRGGIPVLVGGTMLYFNALLRGLAPLPEADPAVRARIDQRALERGWPALHEELAAADPEAAAAIDPRDQQRIQRALEVLELTGRPISELRAEADPDPFPYRRLGLALVPEDRDALHRRIAARLEGMMARGFLEEVQGLRDRPGMRPDLPSMRSVGYRQLWDHLEGRWSLDEAVQRAVYATRQLAKRQLTWLRSMPDIRVESCDAGVPSAALAAAVRTHLEASAGGC